jgi:hypothetical protein
MGPSKGKRQTANARAARKGDEAAQPTEFKASPVLSPGTHSFMAENDRMIRREFNLAILSALGRVGCSLNGQVGGFLCTTTVHQAFKAVYSHAHTLRQILPPVNMINVQKSLISYIFGVRPRSVLLKHVQHPKPASLGRKNCEQSQKRLPKRLPQS